MGEDIKINVVDLSLKHPNLIINKFCININPPTELVIPAAAERRAGIQKRPCDYWIRGNDGRVDISGSIKLPA